MEPTAILADRLVRARRSNLALPAFPGSIPPTAEAAYAVQRRAIRLWGGRPAGWKIGAVRPEWQSAFGSTRFVGPIFSDSIRYASENECVDIPIVLGGFGVVEAELIVELAVDLPPRTGGYSMEELDSAIGRLHVGAEIAGSSVPDIVALGPCAIVADFGVNRGSIVGPEIRNWRTHPLSSLQVSAYWQGQKGNCAYGSAGALEGGLVGALSACVDSLAGSGILLKKGDLISTGALCGLRPLQAGKCAILTFENIGQIEVRFHGQYR